MDAVTQDPATQPVRTCWEEGLGVLCPEAQADGVPCFELGGDCACCDRALVFTAASAPPHAPQVMESLAPHLR